MSFVCSNLKDLGASIGSAEGTLLIASIISTTNLNPGEPLTDGSEQEKLSQFVLIPSNQVLSIEDPFVPSLFLRIFKYVVGMDIYNREDSIFSKKKEINTEI